MARVEAEAEAYVPMISAFSLLQVLVSAGLRPGGFRMVAIFGRPVAPEILGRPAALGGARVCKLGGARW